MLVIGALLHLCGGHWGVLQGIAWAKMLIEYSQVDGLRQGIAKTFDGEHPCEMCRSIAKGRDSEKSDPEPIVRSDDFVLKNLLPMAVIRIERKNILLVSPPVTWLVIHGVEQWRSSPDIPPPRVLA